VSKARRLRELMEQPGVILCPGVYDCVSAKLAERAGFPTAGISGAGLTASLLGYPDVGLQSFSEILNQARNIARSVDIPITIDADTGYGNALNVMRATREFEAAGLAGMMMEDQTFPKRCGHFEGKKVISADEMATKIRAACQARRSDDFVVLARTDALAVEGFDKTIQRVLIYCEAGADMVFVEASASLEHIRQIPKLVPRPTKITQQEGGKTPTFHYQQLHEMGYKLIAFPSLLQRAQIKAGLDALEVLEREGHTTSLYPDRICDHVARSELLGMAQFYELEESLYGPLLDTEGSQRNELRQRADLSASDLQIPI